VKTLRPRWPAALLSRGGGLYSAWLQGQIKYCTYVQYICRKHRGQAMDGGMG